MSRVAGDFLGETLAGDGAISDAPELTDDVDDENHRWTGVDWPDSRYIVVTLSGDVSPNKRHGQLRSVRGWRCRYDLQKGAFDVPPEFKEHNVKAVGPDTE